MSEKEVLVPNIGDFKDVEVIEVLIEAGSNINKDDPIITIESDKSSVEIPSPYSGSVKKVNLKVGDKVSEGSSILIIGSEEEKPDEQIEEEVKESKEETIIQKPPEKVISKPKEIIKNNRVSVFKSSKALASPKTRKFARELGVDINNITGSQRSGRIIEEDIKKFKYIKRLFRRFETTGELKKHLILNHIILLYNVFGDAATPLLFYKIEKNYWPVMKAFLLFLDRLPLSLNKDVNTECLKELNLI